MSSHHRIHRAIVILLLPGIVLWWLLGTSGCTRAQDHEAFLIRVKNDTLTLAEFNQAVEAASEEAFPGEQKLSGDVINDLRMRVLNQLTEEMIIAAFARDHGIAVTEKELEKAVADIKADYPDNTFEETLLENAVSFAYWKKKLATSLLVKKVIEKELVDKVQITSEDVASYYKAHYPEGKEPQGDAEDINRKIVKHLRRLKAEEAYKGWIEGLRGEYPVEINKRAWQKLTGQTS